MTNDYRGRPKNRLPLPKVLWDPFPSDAEVIAISSSEDEEMAKGSRAKPATGTTPQRLQTPKSPDFTKTMINSGLLRRNFKT